MARGSELHERATLGAARCPKPLSDSSHGYNVMSVLDRRWWPRHGVRLRSSPRLYLHSAASGLFRLSCEIGFLQHVSRRQGCPPAVTVGQPPWTWRFPSKIRQSNTEGRTPRERHEIGPHRRCQNGGHSSVRSRWEYPGTFTLELDR